MIINVVITKRIPTGKLQVVDNKTKRANLKTGVSGKQSTSKFPKNKHFLPPDTHTYVCISGGKKYLFFGNFDVLCFPETPVLRFALLPYYERSNSIDLKQKSRWNYIYAGRYF